MSTLTALEKHACPACGAQAEWNPARQSLVCPFCGTESPYALDKDTGAVVELDLVKALRELPAEARGWDTERRSVQCQSCKAVSVFEPDRVGQNCEFCGSAALVDYTELKAPIRPQSLLPFKVSQPQVRESIRGFWASKWLAPNALKSRALVDRVHGLYLPYWTFDAKAVCPWWGDAGFHYYETESYRDSNGRQATRQVQRTRWESRSGVVENVFDDELVPGSRGVPHDLLAQVEPFPTRTDMLPYDKGYLAGFVVEHYQVVLLEAAKDAEQGMIATLRRMASQALGGDTQRGLRIEPAFSERTFKHVLLPVWLLTYNYGPRTYQVVVNGVTGRIAGRYPKSFWKILFLVIGALFALLVILVVSSALDR